MKKNPDGTYHRVRATLDRLWPSAGHQLILSRDGGYIWNPDIPVTLDIDEFDRLCSAKYADDEERLSNLLTALNMYHGDFLSRQFSETWTIPVSAYYHNLYVHSLMEALPLLMEHGRQQEVVDLCQAAIS